MATTTTNPPHAPATNPQPAAGAQPVAPTAFDPTNELVFDALGYVVEGDWANDPHVPPPFARLGSSGIIYHLKSGRMLTRESVKKKLRDEGDTNASQTISDQTGNIHPKQPWMNEWGGMWQYM